MVGGSLVKAGSFVSAATLANRAILRPYGFYGASKVSFDCAGLLSRPQARDEDLHTHSTWTSSGTVASRIALRAGAFSEC